MRTLKNEQLRQKFLQTEYLISHFPESLMNEFILKEYTAGEEIIQQGVLPQELFVLVKGRCRVSELLPNGRTVILRTDGPFCMFGDLELLNKEQVTLSVRAVDTSLLLCMNAKTAGHFLLRDSRFLLALCQEIALRSARSEARLFMRSAYPVRNQAACFILENLHQDLFSIRKSEMADTLGTTYRHIERIMKEFVEEGILTKKQQTYRVVNRSALDSMAAEVGKPAGEPSSH